MKARILMFTRLFPSNAFETNGTFCEQRAKALHKFADVRVMTPTPWFPGMSHISNSWEIFSHVERTSVRAGGTYVTYPRYLSIPATATWWQGISMARSAWHEYKKYHSRWNPDLIDAHFAFPDGYAAVKLAKKIGCPVQITCHGSDIECYPSIPVTGRMLRWALQNADRVICVSKYLRNKCIRLGVVPEKCIVMTNAVDTDLFNVQDQENCRKKVGLEQKVPTALCIGRLAPEKNQIVLLHALAELKKHRYLQFKLVFVGDGPLRSKLVEFSERLGLKDDIIFAGNQPYESIPEWINAADWVVLSSIREGWPTVYYEAQACGKPIITSNVAAAPEAILDPSMGIIVTHNTSSDFAEALLQAKHTNFDTNRIRQNAFQHSWSLWAQDFMHTCRLDQEKPEEILAKAG